MDKGRAGFAIFMIFMLGACSDPGQQLVIPFEAVFGDRPVSCEESGSVLLTDLRFYVYDIRLRDHQGTEHAISLQNDGQWQQPGLALIDLEDGSASCRNGTTVVNSAVSGTIAPGSYKGLTFTLGVPFELNHRDPLLAAPPLDDPDMHWHWRGGYKFLRAGFKTNDDGFWIHLGSTGCRGTIQNITGCDAPNRVVVRLDRFVPGVDSVSVDLSVLLPGTKSADEVVTDCSSGPAEPGCSDAFSALGLDHASGATAGSQQLFGLLSDR